MRNAPHEFIKAVKGIDDLSIAAATGVGNAVDTLGFEDCLVILDTGTANTGLSTCKITECDTSGGSYTDITGAAFTAITTSNDVALYVGRINLEKRKRYLQFSYVSAGTVTDATCIFLLTSGQVVPVTQQNTVSFSV